MNVKARCRHAIVYESSLQRQLECSHLRETITNSILNKSTLQEKLKELIETSYIYDLIITKKKYVGTRIMNHETGVRNSTCFKYLSVKNSSVTRKHLEKNCRDYKKIEQERQHTANVIQIRMIQTELQLHFGNEISRAISYCNTCVWSVFYNFISCK